VLAVLVALAARPAHAHRRAADAAAAGPDTARPSAGGRVLGRERSGGATGTEGRARTAAPTQRAAGPASRLGSGTAAGTEAGSRSAWSGSGAAAGSATRAETRSEPASAQAGALAGTTPRPKGVLAAGKPADRQATDGQSADRKPALATAAGTAAGPEGSAPG